MPETGRFPGTRRPVRGVPGEGSRASVCGEARVSGIPDRLLSPPGRRGILWGVFRVPHGKAPVPGNARRRGSGNGHFNDGQAAHPPDLCERIQPWPHV